MVDSRRVAVPTLVTLALVILLGVLPPETRGESLAGCAVLIALLVTATWSCVPVGAGHVALAAVLLLSCPVILAAAAPGAALAPMAIFAVALAAGLHASALSRAHAIDRWLPLTLSLTAGLIALYALAQGLWLLDAKAKRIADLDAVPDRDLILARLAEGRSFEPFATPAALGAYLALALPVTLGLAASRRGRRRGYLVALAVVQAAGLVATMSVTAAGALLVAGIVGVLARRGARRYRLVAIVTALTIVAGVAALRGGSLTDLTRWDHPWRLRAGNFRVAVEVVRDHPWRGVGPGGYGEVFPQYRLSDDNETRHAHDLPLELTAELGVVAGTAVSIVFFVVFVGPLFRREATEPWRIGLAIGLASFAVQNLGDFTAFFPSLLWLAALLRGTLARPPGDPASPPTAPSTIIRALALTASFLAVGVMVLSGLAWNTRYQARVAAAASDHRQTERYARRAARLAPWDVDAHLMTAQAILRGSPREDSGRASLALEFANRAVALAPVRPMARAVRAQARLRLDDTPGAYADLVEASRLYPANEAYRRYADEIEARLPGPGLRRERP